MHRLIYTNDSLSGGTAALPRARAGRAAPRSHVPALERLAAVLLVVADFAGGLAAFSATLAIYPNNALHLSFLAVAPTAALVALYLIGGYDRRTDFLSVDYFSEHLIACAAAASGSMLVAYLVTTFSYNVQPSRLFIPTFFALFFTVSILSRRALGAYLFKVNANVSFLMLGNRSRAEEFAKIYTDSGLKRRLEFACLDEPGTPSAANPKGDVHDCILEAIDGFRYAAVLLTADAKEVPPKLLQCLVRLHCSGIPVLTLDAFRERHCQRISATAVGPDWLFRSEFALAHGTVYAHVKRIADILFAGCALLALSPFLALIAWIIKRDSPGPAIFKQDRVGREGRVFTMLKFRTMRMGDAGGTTKRGDNRITRIGRVLRASRLDELPQLWNVLVGDMSLIGPRAEWVKCAEVYEREIPHYHIRHLVNPGITGWAQVKFRYGEDANDALHKFEYDLYYIRHFSFALDLRILLKTIHTMLFGRGR